MSSPVYLPSRQPLLWLVAIAFFMQALDSTIVNTALPSMAKSLDASPLRMQSVVVAYVLSVAVLIPASGWLADRVGLRRIFALAMLVFAAGSLACAMANSLEMLVVARVIQGLGGALLMPVGRLAVLRYSPTGQFLAAMSFVTVPGLIGPLIGPTLGGWLVHVASWHWIFLINLPIALIGWIATLRIMPNDHQTDLPRFDLWGYAYLVLAMVGISLALDRLAMTGGQLSNAVLGWLVAGIVGLLAYLWHARRSRSGLLFSPSLFAVAGFRAGILGNLLVRMGGSTAPFILPLYLQLVGKLSALDAGLMMIPLTIGSILVKKILPPLVARFGYAAVLRGNTVLMGLGMMSGVLMSALPQWSIAILFVLIGSINSVQFVSMNALTLKDLPPQAASSGNSLMSMTMMLAMSLGVALASVMVNVFGQIGKNQSLEQAFDLTFSCIGLWVMASSWIFWRYREPEDVAKAT